MELFLSILSAVFDTFVQYIYFKTVYKNKYSKIPHFLVPVSYILVQVVLYANTLFFTGNTSFYKTVITTLISFLTTFALSNLYKGSLLQHIFSAIIYVVFTAIGETLFVIILSIFNKELFNINPLMLDNLVITGMEIFVLIFTYASNVFWNRHSSSYTKKYKLLVFIIPFTTVSIPVFIPTEMLTRESVNTFFLFLISCIIVINIVNFVLLDNVLQLADLKLKYAREQTNTVLQQERYEQLSGAYKNTRRIVHDVKEHYFFIDACINKKQYQAAADYMKQLVSDLENSYTKINTGNLVIDALVSHYVSVAEKENIQMETDISISNMKLPIDDYDLCIILGNMLNNSIKACMQIQSVRTRFVKLQIYMNNKNLVIHTVNPTVPKKQLEKNEFWELYHGYGLENVKAITEEKYGGLYGVVNGENYEVVSSIPEKIEITVSYDRRGRRKKLPH